VITKYLCAVPLEDKPVTIETRATTGEPTGSEFFVANTSAVTTSFSLSKARLLRRENTQTGWIDVAIGSTGQTAAYRVQEAGEAADNEVSAQRKLEIHRLTSGKSPAVAEGAAKEVLVAIGAGTIPWLETIAEDMLPGEERQVRIASSLAKEAAQWFPNAPASRQVHLLTKRVPQP
jgi:hypothetical protein